mgnify:CR=1 FL=1
MRSPRYISEKHIRYWQEEAKALAQENIRLREDLAKEKRERQLAEDILATEIQVWFQADGSTCARVEKNGEKYGSS